jgi:hypothetical protein
MIRFATLAAFAGAAALLGGACTKPSNSFSPISDNNTHDHRTAPSAATQTLFRWKDITTQAGVEFTYHNGREAGHNSILESLGGGVAMVDYDGDLRLDLYFTGGGRFHDQEILGLSGSLWKGLGNQSFREVTATACAQASAYYTHGCQVGDYNNDGFDDILITGYGGLQLLCNQGDGTFTSAAGLEDPLWSTSAAWGDFTGDGFLDLYVAHYVNWSFDNHPACPGPLPNQIEICPPKSFQPLPDALFVNHGDGTFHEARRDQIGLREDGKGLGVIAADYDLDGDLDIYVGNDTTDNFLYLNDGRGAFREVGLLHGVSGDSYGAANGTMGVDVGDYNGDLLPDLWAANFEAEPFALYRNEGLGQFLHVSQPAGVNVLGGLFVGFGTAFLDADGDGWEDLVVANGHVIKYPRAAPVLQKPLLLQNLQGRVFTRIEFPPGEYFSTPHLGRGLAVGDLNDDGALDLAISNTEEPARVLQNETPQAGDWRRVRLIGRKSNRDGLGARLILHSPAGDRVRFVKGGGSYLSQSDLRPHWSLPREAELGGLTVYWPSGVVQTLQDLGPLGDLTMIEPTKP